MADGFSRTRLVGVWLAAVGMIAVAAVVLGAGFSATTGVILLLIALVPPTILMVVWRGAPPVTVAELLRSVDAKDDRR